MKKLLSFTWALVVICSIIFSYFMFVQASAEYFLSSQCINTLVSAGIERSNIAVVGESCEVIK